MSFNVQSQMNGKVAKPVGHIALSFSKEDEPRLTDRAMAVVELEYMDLQKRRGGACAFTGNPSTMMSVCCHNTLESFEYFVYLFCLIFLLLLAYPCHTHG